MYSKIILNVDRLEKNVEFCMYVREIIFQAQNEFANTVKTNEKNAGDYITKLMLVQSLLSVKCTLTSIGAGSHYSR